MYGLQVKFLALLFDMYPVACWPFLYEMRGNFSKRLSVVLWSEKFYYLQILFAIIFKPF
jgi:hypothetical protein